jgi:hypothetical protein
MADRLTEQYLAGLTHHTIVRAMCFAAPVEVGWSSDGNHPMSHDEPLTVRQFTHLMNCNVFRTDLEIADADEAEQRRLSPRTELSIAADIANVTHQQKVLDRRYHALCDELQKLRGL